MHFIKLEILYRFIIILIFALPSEEQTANGNLSFVAQKIMPLYNLNIIPNVTISINTVQITYQNRGSQTDFLVKTNLQLKPNFAGSITTCNAWVGIGFNSFKRMVILFIIF